MALGTLPPDTESSSLVGSKHYFLNVEDDDLIANLSEELWRKPCKICYHNFDSNADYIRHGRIHFIEQQQGSYQQQRYEDPPLPSLPPPPPPPSLPPVPPPPPPPGYYYTSYATPPCDYPQYFCPPPFQGPSQDQSVWSYRSESTTPIITPTMNATVVTTTEVEKPAQSCKGKGCKCDKCKRKTIKKPSKPKIKTVEREQIDLETLKRLKNYEWERKHGHWCIVCKRRFANQERLVDHLSYDHNPKVKG